MKKLYNCIKVVYKKNNKKYIRIYMIYIDKSPTFV